jgi:hypothetical protein
MPNVYVVHDDGATEPMARVRCANEDRELQLILAKNPDLLPGDQIDPENPRRWLPVKREMPVPDPSTGADRWRIDLFLVDQNAIPTFVECKRVADTRSRREVVGQVLEYAANGHYYWTKETIRDLAKGEAERRRTSLEEAIRALQPTNDELVDTFFERVEENLREGQVRIVFFLEESPPELRSVVDFLNRQMERTEVLLVEARQYSRNETRIVVPTLIGYTEQARLVKRSVTVTTAASRRKWNRSTFFADAQAKIGHEKATVVERFFDQCVSAGFEVTWGTGVNNGSFNIKEPSICPRSLVTVWSDGRLDINYGWLTGSEVAERGRERLKDLIAQRVGLKVPDDDARHWPSYSHADWTGKAEMLAEVLVELAREYRSVDA